MKKKKLKTLLGHKPAVMTAIYEDDRGLSAGRWKRLELAKPVNDQPQPAPAGFFVPRT